MWVLYEMAIIQQYLAESSTQKEEWIKKSLLNWNKAVNHTDSNHWVRWGMMECQLKYQKDHDKKRAINQNLKECEKILRETPDSARANFYLGKCYLAFDDLAHTQKAISLFEKANFLDPELTELHLVHAKACKNLGKSVLVDSIGYNMILLEPELAQTIFQL
jgi:lipopolysaccharide biosynthesis regulator YciM